MANIVEFNLSADEYMQLADKRLNEGDVEGAIKYLKKALAEDKTLVEAYCVLAEIYAGFGAYQISNATLYRALVQNPDEEQESRIFLRLASNFMDLNLSEVSYYYMRYFGEDFANFEMQDAKRNMFRVVDNPMDDYNSRLLDEAYERINMHQFDKAIESASQITDDSPKKNAANHIILIAYLMRNQTGKVIEEARRMLAVKDNLAIKTTLASAYIMQGDKEQAREVVDEILARGCNELEEILMVLPLFVSLDMHVELVLYTKRVLDTLHFQPNTMMWLAQGLFNLGQREEALKVMHKVDSIYGENAPAEYYISYFEHGEPPIEYSMNLPLDERIKRYKIIEEYAKMPFDEFDALLKDGTELTRLLRWVFIDGNRSIEDLVLGRLQYSKEEWVNDFYRDQLLSPQLSFDNMAKMLAHLLNGGYHLDFSIVTQDRFKDISFDLPRAYFHLPKNLKESLGYSICDIIYTDEDATEYIARLTRIVNSIVDVKNDELVWLDERKEKCTRLRSVKTLAGVLLARVYYDEPDAIEDSLVRYGLNKRTFDRYYNLFFGDDYED